MQYIQAFERLPPVSEVVQHEDVYEFRRDRKWQWLQRLCFWVLGKIGAFRQDTMAVYNYGPTDPKPLKEAVFAQIENVVEFERFDSDELVVLIGRPQFKELVSNREMYQCLGWGMTLDVRDAYSKRIYTIPIAAVPWLDGIAVVPAAVLRSGKPRGVVGRYET